jgi:glycosyltransferase involved in cell wall biosynthesis
MSDQALAPASEAGETSRARGPGRALRIALVGNFPPRRCGIATFTSDVHDALVTADPAIHCRVFAMRDEGGAYAYPPPVAHEVRQNELADYAEAAQAVTDMDADILCLQHEYGIFGGPSGEHVLTLLYGVACPVVTTLHTILESPSDEQRRVMAAIIARSSKLIVMARKGHDILREVYDAPAAKIAVVAHGAPDRPFTDGADAKNAFGLAGRDVLLTFGLLSPNKGIEAMIRAMPAIRDAHPAALYVVLGATHPHLIAREGEAYRERLVALAMSCGVLDSVRFVNAFVENDTLFSYLEAADVYISPYLNEAQITSGTLSYAVALGKPVVSTPYWHARELLADGVGMLVPFNDSASLAERSISLLSDHGAREDICANAYRVGRAMIWPRLAEHYIDILSAAARPQTARPAARREMRRDPPAPSLAGVARMSDACGILQHASYGVADRAHGYCVDDNARALILINRCAAAGFDADACERLGDAYAAFVNHAWNEDKGRFRNFMSYDRAWLEEAGSDDSFGRSIWALGETMARTRRPEMALWARGLFARALPHAREIASPRASAFIILGLVAALGVDPARAAARDLLIDRAEDLATRLAAHRDRDWIWFEPYIAYDNARLCEALIRAGALLRRPALVRAGVESLRWLNGLQSTPTGLFRAIGTAGIGARLASAPPFDQQPVEAAATIDACAAAFEATGDAHWLREAHRAFDWFLGANDLGAPLADPVRGVCYDGLTPERVNLNQGAESILAFQLGACAIHALTRAARLAPAMGAARH